MQINHYFKNGKETILGIVSQEEIFKCQRANSKSLWNVVMSKQEPFDLLTAAEIINCKVSVLAVIQKMEKNHESKPPTNSSVA